MKLNEDKMKVKEIEKRLLSAKKTIYQYGNRKLKKDVVFWQDIQDLLYDLAKEEKK
jgi:hypothetical protein